MRKMSRMAAFLVALALSWNGKAGAQNADFHVVPLPKEVRATQAGNFELSEKTLISYPQGDKTLKRHAEYLAQFIEEATGLKLTLTTVPVQRNCIRLSTALKKSNPEAYLIRVNSEIVLIDGVSTAGLFYGIQTFRKALPVGTVQRVVVPGTEVSDQPRFAYRGAHLDVSRHFVSVDSVCRFIDMLALHNINRFHWHLTDDQGWRVEIKKYPLLTKIGSRRSETVIGHNTGKYDGKPYGGFYTQKEIRQVVQYAADRHITIIPEIDMPGHMQAALAAYPELGCTGGPYEVWKMWGVSEHVLCAGNDKTLRFIEDVLAEIVKLFPSEYIHVGGDECPKTQWEQCAKCQARIKAEHLEADGKHSAEERLQSYVIHHAEEFLRKQGRRMIGWDETLEGGLAPGATVMSWRGEGGGIEAARQQHDVIMTPNTYMYFDYYQSDTPQYEPEAIGGYVPIERVYGYEPVPAVLRPEERKYIIGVQANCWAEYLKSYRQVEYMELPRMAALSEVQWCNPEQKNYEAFVQRLQRLVSVYRLKGYNYAKVIYRVKSGFRVDTVQHAVVATLSTIDDAPVYYTLDGTAPTTASPRYEGPLRLTQSGTLRAVAVRGGEVTPEVSETFTFSRSTACPIRLLSAPHGSYTFAGAQVLNDGRQGRSTNYRTGEWLGFCEGDLEAEIDLGRPTQISSVTIRTCVEKGDWIFDARSLEVYGSSDGKTFTPLASETYAPLTRDDANRIYTHQLDFAPATVRYVRVKAVSEKQLPEWHSGAGHPAFLFVDEVQVK